MKTVIFIKIISFISIFLLILLIFLFRKTIFSNEKCLSLTKKMSIKYILNNKQNKIFNNKIYKVQSI